MSRPRTEPAGIVPRDRSRACHHSGSALPGLVGSGTHSEVTFDFTSFRTPASGGAIVLEEWLGIFGIRVHSLKLGGVGFDCRNSRRCRSSVSRSSGLDHRCSSGSLDVGSRNPPIVTPVEPDHHQHRQETTVNRHTILAHDGRRQDRRGAQDQTVPRTEANAVERESLERVERECCQKANDPSSLVFCRPGARMRAVRPVRPEAAGR